MHTILETTNRSPKAGGDGRKREVLNVKKQPTTNLNLQGIDNGQAAGLEQHQQTYRSNFQTSTYSYLNSEYDVKFHKKLLIPLNESLESRYRKRVTKGGVLRGPDSLKRDLR